MIKTKASLITITISLLALLLSLSSYAKGRVMYALPFTPVYVGGPNGKVAAILKIGATVIPVKKSGNGYEVKIIGWQIEGYPKAVFAFEGIRIQKMTLTSEGEKLIKVLKKVNNQTTGLTWKEIKLSGVWIKASSLKDNAQEVWKPAATLFHQRCSMCHALPRPTQFTANQWPATLRVMTKRAALDKKQTEMVSLFLQYHARGMKKIISSQEK